MDADGGYRDGRVRLPESGGPAPAGRTRGRRDGIRHARRVSNWTAAALIAGTAVAAVGLAHQALAGPGRRPREQQCRRPGLRRALRAGTRRR